MKYNEEYFEGLEGGLYAITYTCFGTKTAVIKKADQIYFVIFSMSSKATLKLTARGIADHFQGDLIHHIKPLRFGPENSEYAGNSRSGQSAGTDLIEKLAPLGRGFESGKKFTDSVTEKINELVDRVNQLSKPSETTKEQPIFARHELLIIQAAIQKLYGTIDGTIKTSVLEKVSKLLG